jgi:hypothetical protein
MIFFNCRKIWRKIGVLTRINGNFSEKVIITLVFEKNANFLPKKAKIAENCHHAIGPWFLKSAPT